MGRAGVLVSILCFTAVGAQVSDNKCDESKLENGRFISWFLLVNKNTRYICDDGYVPANKVNERYGTAKCTSTGWYPEPKCLGPCSVSKEDMGANSIAMGVFWWFRRSTVEHGESVSFRCVQGYGISDSSLLRVQCNNGVISYPKCTKLESCGPPPVVIYGETLQDRMKSYEHGSQLTYKCPLYYTLEGSQNVTCRDGKWDDPPACKEPCTLAEEDMEANGIRRGHVFWFRGSILQHGDSVMFRCVPGYDISKFSLLRVKCNNGVIPYPKCTKLE